MMKLFSIKFYLLLFLAAVFLSGSNLAVAEIIDEPLAGWEARLVVSAGTAKNKLVFGQMPGATDGYDGRFEVPAMLSGTVKAYFEGQGARLLWRDIKSLSGTKSWPLNIEAADGNANITVKWSQSNIPVNYNVTLFDTATGSSVNMSSSSFYTYKNNGPRKLIIRTTSPDALGEYGEDENHNFSSTGDGNSASGSNKNININNYGTAKRFEKDKGTVKKKLQDEDKNLDDITKSASSSFDTTYKPSDAVLVRPRNIEGYLEDGRGLYLMWKDLSTGDHGFVVESRCTNDEGWSAVAGLWGVSPVFEDRYAKFKTQKDCHFRVVALDFPSESGYSDVVGFDGEGKVYLVQKGTDKK